MSQYTLTAAGAERFPVHGTFRWTDQLNGRDTCTFTVDWTDATTPIVTGSPVTVTVNGVAIFGGTVDRVTERDVRLSTTHVRRRLTYHCVDYSQLADRRLVNEGYTDQTADAIAIALVNTYLAGEGVTTNGVVAGPTVARANWSRKTVAQCLNELSEVVGYFWRIDEAKDLRFFPREQNAAPFAIDTSYRPYTWFQVERSRYEYRNQQYVKAGTGFTLQRTETFAGDGERRVFTVGYAVGKVPTVEVDTGGGWVAKTVGILQVDTGKDWYWSKGAKELVQSDSGTVLATTHKLRVTYEGLYPITAVARDEAAIADRKAVEGGTGIYDSVVDAPEVDTVDQALELARGKLRRFASIGQVISYETDVAGLRAGQIQTIILPEHGLNGTFLIDEVTAVERGDPGGHLRFVVRALDGERVGGWVAFFRSMVEAGRQFTIRENEVLEILRTQTDTLVLSDSVTVETHVPATAFVVGTARVGYSEVL